ncbi:MAG: hypothetical protein ACETWM_03490 [Candidatus Lokiarchaeia archaeon]
MGDERTRSSGTFRKMGKIRVISSLKVYNLYVKYINMKEDRDDRR